MFLVSVLQSGTRCAYRNIRSINLKIDISSILPSRYLRIYQVIYRQNTSYSPPRLLHIKTHARSHPRSTPMCHGPHGRRVTYLTLFASHDLGKRSTYIHTDIIFIHAHKCSLISFPQKNGVFTLPCPACHQ